MEHNRFPELSVKQITRIKPFGVIEEIPSGTVLIPGGTRGYDFFILLKGKIRIQSATDETHVIVVHTKNQFTGDSDMLSNRAAHFEAIAIEDSKVIKVQSKRFNNLISQYPDISDLLLSTFILRQSVVIKNFQGGLQLIGSNHSKTAYVIRDFLSKNHVWHSWLPIEDAEDVNDILQRFSIQHEELPILLDSHGNIHRRPTLKDVAKITGVILEFNEEIYDVVVVGAGPGGLGASVYAASEGLKVLTVDSNAPGGQAGKSSKIENYLGFPTGISGEDLAKRAYLQAQKFGCHISIPHKVQKLVSQKNKYWLEFEDGSQVQTKAVIVATGVTYRKLQIENFEKYEGQGVYYSASNMNISACMGQEVVVIGGGNSAGQAAMFLSDYASMVHLIVRSGDLSSKMSDYLVRRIYNCTQVMVHLNTQVTALFGEDYLKQVEVSTKEKEKQVLNVENLFTFIGAKPCTDWIDPSVKKDAYGFLLTGAETVINGFAPQTLETNFPGLFAVGDVRQGSTKRVASAVGEGALAVSQVHQFLSRTHPIFHNA